MTKREIIERICQGVLRVRPGASQQEIRMRLDAAFPQISNEVAEAFAEREDRRATLRGLVDLTFAGGTATIPNTVLKKYLDDASLVILDSDGNIIPIDFREPYSDFSRTYDTRLAYWAVNDSTAYAKTPQSGVLTDYGGAAKMNCIAAPPIPAIDAEYVSVNGGSLDDMVPQLIDAGISFMLGQSEHGAAETA